MALFNSVLTWIMKQRIHQIELFMKYPTEIQNDCFQWLISSAKNTVWGEKYGYNSISKPSQYKERVPIKQLRRTETLYRPHPQRRTKRIVAAGDHMVCQIIGHHRR